MLRVLRVLRPLRLISRNAGMKLIITSLFKAMPAVSNVFGVIFVLQLVFAILGMQMFSGMLARCDGPGIHDQPRRASARSAPMGETPPSAHSMTSGSAMRLLYVMSSGDEWECRCSP